MNEIFIALGGGLVGFSLSLLFFKGITYRMMKRITGISEWYIVPCLQELRKDMSELQKNGSKDYSFEIARVDTLISKFEELNEKGKNLWRNK